MQRAPPELNKIPDAAPITTPPERVALSKCSMVNLFFKKALVMNVARQLPVSARMVFEMTCVFVKGVVAKMPKLNDGQYIHRKSVPMKAKMFDV